MASSSSNVKVGFSNFSKLDGIITIEDDSAIKKAKELAKENGLFVGISAGANILAAEKLAKDNPKKVIVAIVPDSGDRYLSVW